MDETEKTDTLKITIPILPQRTTIHIVGVDDNGNAVIDYYKCLDCKLKTPYLNVILRHQAHPGPWHRLKRWMMRLPNRPVIEARPATLGGSHAAR